MRDHRRVPRSTDALERVVRDEWSAVVASLVRQFGDLDLAEDSAQDAAVQALDSWPRVGIPDRPGAWLLVTARRRAVDRVRRDQVLRRKLAQLGRDPVMADVDLDEIFDESTIGDDQLALIFGCCHPSLSVEAQVALVLRSLCGLSTTEVARAFLVPEATMAQRLVRAKRKISAAGVPFVVPADHDLVDRIDAVLAVVYLVFNEGYAATVGDDVVRVELLSESIRLARLLARLLPDDAEALGLLALLLLTDARRPARLDDDGDLVPLERQDRSRWDTALIAEGMLLLDRAARRRQIGPYQVQAAIAAVHDGASDPDLVDWHTIVRLYDTLLALRPSGVVALNRAVAVGMAEGPAAGLAAVEMVDAARGGEGGGRDGHLLHAARGDLLRRAGRLPEAHREFVQAAALASTEPERRFLLRQAGDLSS